MSRQAKHVALLLGVLGAAAGSPGFANEPAQTPEAVVRLDETVISGNQELPKVLYILPWRQPEGLPAIEVEAPLSEADVFRHLHPPAYRRELEYVRTLDAVSE